MYIWDHKPVLAMAATSAGNAVVQAATQVQEHAVSVVDVVDKWVHLIGGIIGILAGCASVSWYVYSYMNAKKKTPQYLTPPSSPE